MEALALYLPGALDRSFTIRLTVQPYPASAKPISKQGPSRRRTRHCALAMFTPTKANSLWVYGKYGDSRRNVLGSSSVSTPATSRGEFITKSSGHVPSVRGFQPRCYAAAYATVIGYLVFAVSATDRVADQVTQPNGIRCILPTACRIAWSHLPVLPSEKILRPAQSGHLLEPSGRSRAMPLCHRLADI